MPKIVILDGYATNPKDLSWEAIEAHGDLIVYDRTSRLQVIKRCIGADIVVVNKCILDKQRLRQIPGLKCICTLATGYNNVDVEAAKEFGITVCNAVDYSAPSVAQHVFALLLALINQVEKHNRSVQKNEWANAIDWSYWKSPIMELAGKTMGIYGYGKIGQRVGEIALAFGMKVIAVRKSETPPTNKKVKLVTNEQLFKESDILSLHASLSRDNEEIINRDNLELMKETAYLINTGRGGLINERDLKRALVNKTIAGAGLDVLTQEPPQFNHLLLGLSNCLITPHQAWATKESRKRLIDIVATNISSFLAGEPQNVVN